MCSFDDNEGYWRGICDVSAPDNDASTLWDMWVCSSAEEFLLPVGKLRKPKRSPSWKKSRVPGPVSRVRGARGLRTCTPHPNSQKHMATSCDRYTALVYRQGRIQGGGATGPSPPQDVQGGNTIVWPPTQERSQICKELRRRNNLWCHLKELFRCLQLLYVWER